MLNQISVRQFLVNFINPSLINLILLIIISGVIAKSNLSAVFRRLNYGKKRNFLKLSLFSGFLSAFVNNTVVVSLAIKTLLKHKNAAKILLPVTYIAILAGTCTLIGTSTNLILNGLVVENGLPELEIFDFAYVGIPLFIAGSLYLILAYNRILSDKELTPVYNGTNYFLEACVQNNSSLIGKSIKENRLRNLENLYLAEIIRNNKLISPVRPDEIIEENDILVFTGDIDNIKDLQKIEGLKIFEDRNAVLKDNLIWAVLSHNSYLVGKTIKEASFRANFDAAVVAVKRGHEKLSGKIGSIKMKTGDYLILAVGEDFHKNEDLHDHFYITSDVEVTEKLNAKQSLFVLITFIAGIIISAIGLISLFKVLMILLFLYLFSGLLAINEMKKLFNLDLLVLVGSALGISKVLIDSGAATLVADSIIHLSAGAGIYGSLIGIYLLTLIFTEIITNNAVAALVFPIAYSTAISLGVNPLPFIMVVAYGASASFITPWGYHANLMVYNTGNYKPADFFKLGLPLSIIYSILVIILVPVFFKF
jgi:di/tricarboxylate transporter